MFTLFFGGNDFAPATKIDGVPVQEYLQSHYINAIKQVALRLKDLPNVVGYDSLNEPGGGFIGSKDLNTHQHSLLALGTSPTPYQAMLLGAGYPQEVDVLQMGFSGAKATGKKLLNSNGERLWRAGYQQPNTSCRTWLDVAPADASGVRPAVTRRMNSASVTAATAADSSRRNVACASGPAARSNSVVTTRIAAASVSVRA